MLLVLRLRLDPQITEYCIYKACAAFDLVVDQYICVDPSVSMRRMLIMYFFDRATDTNYWFMAGPGYDSPLTSFYERGGYGGYLTAFILIGTAVTALWYGLRYLFLLRRARK